MKTIARAFWIFFFASVAGTPSANAGDGAGTVQISTIYPTNLVFFYMSQRLNGDWPVCASNSKRWVLDISTSEGRARYALLLAAQIANKPVYVTGTGACDTALSGDSEKVWHLGLPVDSSQIH